MKLPKIHLHLSTSLLIGLFGLVEEAAVALADGKLSDAEVQSLGQKLVDLVTAHA